MPIKKVLAVTPTGRPEMRVPVKVWTEDVEASAQDQLRNIAALPFIHKHVAAMPDVHWGMGATVGSVLACRRAVIPAAVGVDIGCGMMAVQTSLNAFDLPDNLSRVRSSIERSVPVGFNKHPDMPRGKQGQPIADLATIHRTFEPIIAKHPKIAWKGPGGLNQQLGTLGGGNHFIEVCLDKDGNVWVMLHSGSRNIGKVIADYFISRAKELAERYFLDLPDANLAYLPQGEQEFDDYVEAVQWAQDYAMANREAMMSLVLAELAHYFPQMKVVQKAINCHHNYISLENHYGENVIVTRKGAIRAREGDLGIIPGSMGARSFIVRGKGNPESFHSCSHGAGRKMSRKEAQRTFGVSDLEAQTEGIECRKDEGVVDEIPGAYKDIDVVMENQTDLVEVVAELRQVLCVKG